MIDEQGSADLTCRFCDNVQHFSRADLEAMVRGLQKKCKKLNFQLTDRASLSIITFAV